MPVNIQPKDRAVAVAQENCDIAYLGRVPLPRRSFPFRLLATSSLATRSPWRQPLCTFTTMECSDWQRCRWSRPANGISLIRTFSVANCACLALCIRTVPPRLFSFLGIVTRVWPHDLSVPLLSSSRSCFVSLLIPSTSDQIFWKSFRILIKKEKFEVIHNYSME